MANSRWEEFKAQARERLAQNPLYKQAGWVGAHARLLAILPNAQTTIPAPYSMTPDRILQAAGQAGFAIESIMIYNPWRADPAGIGPKSFEEHTDLELFDLVFAQRPPTPGPLWFIPDDCFAKCDPYLVTGETLRGFVESI